MNLECHGGNNNAEVNKGIITMPQRTLTLWEKTYAILVAEKERTGVPMNRIIHDAVVKYCEERKEK